MIRETVTAWPLYWPPGWERTKSPRQGPFYNQTVYKASQGILYQLSLMGVARHGVVLSTNLKLKADGTPYSGRQSIADHGASVWFSLDGQERVLACDRWAHVADNLRAIEKHIEAIRGMERWGVGSAAQAFAGFVALPETSGGEPWNVTLGVSPDASRETIEAAYRRKALECHPDRGGRREDWDHLQAVRKIALQARGAA